MTTLRPFWGAIAIALLAGGGMVLGIYALFGGAVTPAPRIDRALAPTGAGLSKPAPVKAEVRPRRTTIRVTRRVGTSGTRRRTQATPAPGPSQRVPAARSTPTVTPPSTPAVAAPAPTNGSGGSLSSSGGKPPAGRFYEDSG